MILIMFHPLCVLSALNVIKSLKKSSFIFLDVPAWQQLAKTFLREWIKVTSKQVCYCSAAWVPASRKQSDDSSVEVVNENCKFSTNVDLVCYFILFFFLSGVNFIMKQFKSKSDRVEVSVYKAELRDVDSCISQGRRNNCEKSRGKATLRFWHAAKPIALLSPSPLKCGCAQLGSVSRAPYPFCPICGSILMSWKQCTLLVI